VYFYEIHESDDDLYSDALLAHEQEFTAEEFFELVQETRRRVQDSFEEDTLVEAIAHELERTQDFLYVSDALLVAAVNVSRIEEDNFIAEVEEGDEEEDRDGEDDDEDGSGNAGRDTFRTLLVDLDRERPN
jgi:hypothetical protein